ncbi:MAG: hypothetical protein ACMUIE_08290 [Thermoplasmatota archaeon]
MTMGLKIHRMLKEDGKDAPELVEEAKRRKDVSDSILESIYHRLTLGKRKRSHTQCEEDDEEGN